MLNIHIYVSTGARIHKTINNVNDGSFTKRQTAYFRINSLPMPSVSSALSPCVLAVVDDGDESGCGTPTNPHKTAKRFDGAHGMGSHQVAEAHHFPHTFHFISPVLTRRLGAGILRIGYYNVSESEAKLYFYMARNFNKIKYFSVVRISVAFITIFIRIPISPLQYICTHYTTTHTHTHIPFAPIHVSWSQDRRTSKWRCVAVMRWNGGCVAVKRKRNKKYNINFDTHKSPPKMFICY